MQFSYIFKKCERERERVGQRGIGFKLKLKDIANFEVMK